MTISKKKEPQQDRSKHMVDSILQSVVELVSDGDQNKLTTTTIASRAGVSVGSLYQYFPSKEAIFKSLIEWHFKKEFGLICEALSFGEGKTLDEAIDDMLMRTFAIRIKNRRIEQALIHFFFRVGDAEFLKKFDEKMIVELEKVLVKGEQDGKLKRNPTTAFLLLHIVRSSLIAVTLEKPELLENMDRSKDLRLNLKKALSAILN
jgi:AcrR family transcriptional regulator